MSKNGPGVFHIFFTNDLLLFGEASFSQARIMEFTLGKFYGLFGHRMNRAKLKL